MQHKQLNIGDYVYIDPNQYDGANLSIYNVSFSIKYKIIKVFHDVCYTIRNDKGEKISLSQQRFIPEKRKPDWL